MSRNVVRMRKDDVEQLFEMYTSIVVRHLLILN
jgi:hypothetical protein